MSVLPEARGEISEHLLGALAGRVRTLTAADLAASDDPLGDDDLQLALYLCYELHYRGLPAVDDDWEWEPSLIALRRELEASFQAALRVTVPEPEPPAEPEAMDIALRAIADSDDAPSMSRFIERRASLEQLLEFVVHRSAYQLKEADPHSWALPRLEGGPKAAIVQIQFDEYGGGRAECIHAQMFADTMDELDLDPGYGAYVDLLPGVTLATTNLMSLFGLHRSHLGAIVGHLALFEMSSSVPNARYARGLRRLGFGPRATAFFDEHVEADAVHESLAAVDLAAGLARQQPALARDIVWGAAALVELEGRWTRRLLAAWEAGESSLLGALPARLTV